METPSRFSIAVYFLLSIVMSDSVLAHRWQTDSRISQDSRSLIDASLEQMSGEEIGS
jgi:hypothetical protein